MSIYLIIAGSASVIIGLVLCVFGLTTYVPSLRPVANGGVTVMVCGGGDLFGAPFPEDEAINQVTNLTRWLMPDYQFKVGRIITHNRYYGEKIVRQWAIENGIEVVVFEKPRLFENIYRTMIEAGRPDIIIHLAGVTDDWRIVERESTRAGFETAYSWALASTKAKPEWITDNNNIVRPEVNPSPRHAKAAAGSP